MDIHISRSEQKRRIKQLEKLVVEISSLPHALIEKLPCDAEIQDLFLEVAALKGGARKRLIKYITKQLKNEQEEVENLYDFMAKKQGKALKEKKDFHEIEFLRDSLLNEAIQQFGIARENHQEMEEDWSSEVATQVAGRFPKIDLKALKRLSWLFAKTRSRRYDREVFRLLRAAQEQKKTADSRK